MLATTRVILRVSVLAAIDDPKQLDADEHLQRVYRLQGGQRTLSAWMAYSGTGADRGHHPA